jgi:hypothetical protein
MSLPTVVSLTGNDTVVLSGRVLTNFGDADNATLTFPSDIAAVKTGKNGNAIFALNTMGLQAEMVLRIIRGSQDDLFLNGILSTQLLDFSSFVLLTGQFIKRIGDGQGNVQNDTYLVAGGVFMKQVEAKSNVEGDTEQSLAIYHVKFSNVGRAQM